MPKQPQKSQFNNGRTQWDHGVVSTSIILDHSWVHGGDASWWLTVMDGRCHNNHNSPNSAMAVPNGIMGSYPHRLCWTILGLLEIPACTANQLNNVRSTINLLEQTFSGRTQWDHGVVYTAGPFLGSQWLMVVDAYSKFPYVPPTSSTKTRIPNQFP
uniref:Uncharacterized protein n=1 Tax=Acrobeloides nanus TaxID=290746 RepID=A0A914DKX2_9BILA